MVVLVILLLYSYGAKGENQSTVAISADLFPSSSSNIFYTHSQYISFNSPKPTTENSNSEAILMISTISVTVLALVFAAFIVGICLVLVKIHRKKQKRRNEHVIGRGIILHDLQLKLRQETSEEESTDWSHRRLSENYQNLLVSTTTFHDTTDDCHQSSDHEIYQQQEEVKQITENPDTEGDSYVFMDMKGKNPIEDDYECLYPVHSDIVAYSSTEDLITDNQTDTQRIVKRTEYFHMASDQSSNNKPDIRAESSDHIKDECDYSGINTSLTLTENPSYTLIDKGSVADLVALTKQNEIATHNSDDHESIGEYVTIPDIQKEEEDDEYVIYSVPHENRSPQITQLYVHESKDGSSSHDFENTYI